MWAQAGIYRIPKEKQIGVQNPPNWIVRNGIPTALMSYIKDK